ncbi:MAG: universal stress protein [Acidobacteriaceae bacterium]|nr:universal stress protein [Acidobacteriaceae bacterium]
MLLKISRILVPVDFSDRCLAMVRFARVLAQQYQAELILLHVVNPVFVAPETGISGPAFLPVPKWLIERESGRLDNFAKEQTDGLPVRRLVYEGLPEAQIVELAKAEEVDLVAIPAHGLGVFRRLLIGSVTAKVLDDVACPVLTGAHIEKEHHAYSPTISSIVCGVDPRSPDSKPLEWAASLANDFGARLAVVHSCAYMEKGSRPEYADQLQPQLAEIVREQIRKLGGEIGRAPESIEVSVKEGDPPHAVCGFARSIGADLVVIGRPHEQPHPGRLSSDVYNIISHSPCPVLSV